MPFLLALILPMLGAVGTLVVSLLPRRGGGPYGTAPRLRPYASYVALTAAGLTVALLLTTGWGGPVLFFSALWRPAPLFGATLVLQTDVAMQPLALALALATFSAFLVKLSCPEEQRQHSWLSAALLTLLASGLAALWAANLFTMIVSWAVYDLSRAAGYIAAGGSKRTAVRGLVFGSLATLLLWGGTLLSGGGAGHRPVGADAPTGSDLWVLMAPGNVQLTLWALAGVLRLWLYPFHLPTPSDLGDGSPLAAPLLLGPIVGWGLWLRLASANGGSIPGGAWVLASAAITCALGGFLAWSCKSPRRSLPWVGMGVTGALLLAAGLAGEAAGTIITAGGAAWALGVPLLFLGGGLQRKAPWWSIPALVGALALAGAPLTLGFVTEATLVGGLAEGEHIGWGGAFFVGYLFLIPSLVRWLLSSSPFSSSDPVGAAAPTGHCQRWLLAARGAGLGIPALLLIVAGLHPPVLVHDAPSLSLMALLARPGLMGWLLWALSLAGGGVLAWRAQRRNLRSKIELWLNAAHELLRLEWLYEILVGALERGLSVLRVADEIMGGAGALLWSWLLFLVLLLVWGDK